MGINLSQSYQSFAKNVKFEFFSATFWTILGQFLPNVSNLNDAYGCNMIHIAALCVNFAPIISGQYAVLYPSAYANVLNCDDNT